MCQQGSCKGGCGHKSLKAFGLLVLRVIVGMVFLYTGYMKLGPNHAGASMMMEKMVGLPAGDFWAYFVGGLELVGGLMLILGVYARYATVWLSIIMLVAIFTVHRGAPFMGNNGFALPLVLLGACLGIMGTGAGKWRLVQCECHCKMCMNKEGGSCGCGGAGACCKGGDQNMGAVEKK